MWKKIIDNKVRDHCHLTGSYRGVAHSKCNVNVTQKPSKFIPVLFHNFSNYDCHLFFKKLVERKKDKVEFEIIPKTKKEYISVTYRCIRFIDNYRFLSSSLDSLVKTLVDISHETLKILKKEIVDNDETLIIINDIEEDRTIEGLQKKSPDKIKELEETLIDYMREKNFRNIKTGFPDKWKFLTKKLAYPNEYFKSIDDYKKPVFNIKKEDFFSKLKDDYPSDKEIERTMIIFKRLKIENGEELTEIYLKVTF